MESGSNPSTELVHTHTHTELLLSFQDTAITTHSCFRYTNCLSSTIGLPIFPTETTEIPDVPRRQKVCAGSGPTALLLPAEHVAKICAEKPRGHPSTPPPSSIVGRIERSHRRVLPFHLHPDKKKTHGLRLKKGASVPGQCSTAAFLWFQT